MKIENLTINLPNAIPYNLFIINALHSMGSVPIDLDVPDALVDFPQHKRFTNFRTSKKQGHLKFKKTFGLMMRDNTVKDILEKEKVEKIRSDEK